MTANTTAIPLEDLIAFYEDSKNGHGKRISIVRSVSALVSAISSSLLILSIFRSQKRLTTTYHRLLFGMSISDFIFALGLASSNAMAPKDSSYAVWNARGNQASCDASGFFIQTGAGAGVFYSCSLNLYYLAKVKYNKSDDYISRKLEPFLHGISIGFSLIFNISLFFRHHFNESNGACAAPIYDPPHCVGYEDGEVREGFVIPCGRGRGGGGATYVLLSRAVVLLFPPIIIGVSLGMIYRFVSKQERRISSYGVGSINPNENAAAANSDDNRANESRRLSASINSAFSSISNRFRRRSSLPTNSNQEYSMSQAVMHRAFAYSMSYFLSWIWPIVATLLMLAGVWGNDPSSWPTWQLVYGYFMTILNSLQGFFNFLVFMHPKVMKARRSTGENMSWCQAFVTALSSTPRSQ